MGPFMTMADASGFGRFSTARLKRTSCEDVTGNSRSSRNGHNTGVKGPKSVSQQNV